MLLLTETWLTSDIKSSELLLSQYNVVRADRKSKTEKCRQGGCLIAVSNNVSLTEVDISHLPDAIQESLVVIKLNQPDPAVIALFYNLPKRSPYRQELPPWVSSETSHKLNKLRTLRRKPERCVNFSPYLATQLIELEKHCANLQERDRQEYEEELISGRNRSRIFK